MFSGLLRYTTLLAISLAGLLMLCTSLSQADEGTPVLSLYMSNSGIQLTFGMSDSPEPLVEFTKNTWDDAELYGHPPSLALNDSPIIFFRNVLDTVALDIQRALRRVNQLNFGTKPMEVYIAAAGADAAEKLGLPSHNAYRLLRGDQFHECTKPGMNRKEFFGCFAQYEVLRSVYQSRDASKVHVLVEQDVSLVAAMASQHAKSLNREEPGRASIVVHSTTLSNPYLVRNGEAVSIGGWIPGNMEKAGGIYELGQAYKSYLLKNPGESTPLAKVIALDPRTANHPSGKAANIERLLRGKGYVNFGRLVGETANSLNKARIETSMQTSINISLFRQATAEALPMVHQARTNFLALTTAFYALTEKEFAGRAPHVIIVGEESDVLFPSVSDFVSQGAAIAGDATALTGLVHPIVSRKNSTFSSPNKTQQWIISHAADLFSNVDMVNAPEFARFQHQASMLRLPLQSPAN